MHRVPREACDRRPPRLTIGGRFVRARRQRSKRDLCVMRNRIAHQGVAICVVAFVCGAVWMFLYTGRWDSKEVLAVDEPALEFGQAMAQPRFPWTLPIRNRSGSEVRIIRFRPACRCTVVEPTPVVIPAHATAEIRLLLDLMPAPQEPQREVLSGPRDFMTRLEAIIDAETPRSVRWSLHGRVVSHPIVVSTRRLDFEDSLVKGLAFPKRTFRVRSDRALSALAVTCDPSMATVETIPLGSKGDEYEVRVEPRATLDVGSHVFEVQLQGTLRGAPAISLPGFPVEVQAHVRYDVKATPERVVLGLHRVGSVVSETIVLGSNSRPFVVVGTSGTPGDSVQLAPVQAPGVRGQAYRLSKRVTSPGVERGSARFVIKQDSNREAYTIVIPVVCEGIAN